MDTDEKILAELNPEQREAVCAPPGPILVVAGAGTGKTRVLVHRVAWLVAQGYDPERILLLTFTNKAASEMLHRTRSLVGTGAGRLLGGTFHHVANSLLRRDGMCEALGYRMPFTILDQEDAQSCISECVGKVVSASGDAMPKPAVLGSVFSYAMNSMADMRKVVERRLPRFIELSGEIEAVFEAYMKRKLEYNAMDFDDLLANFLLLLRTSSPFRESCRERFQHMLVDEYQDTNRLQAEILVHLAGEGRSIMAVGDDAQSIYSFRAADVHNMLEFERMFPGARRLTVRINYRSTPEILAAANASIRHNRSQFKKELKAVVEEGTKPLLVCVHDDFAQADFVAQYLGQARRQKVPFANIAILFRSRYLATRLEYSIRQMQIPYVLRGGVRLVEQAHIKDCLAFLRVLASVRDGLAWLRLLKMFPGIGDKTAARIVDWLTAGDLAADLASVADKRLDRPPELGGKMRTSYDACLSLLRDARVSMEKDGVRAALDLVMERFLAGELHRRYDDGDEREAGAREFCTLAGEASSLPEFLAQMALDERALLDESGVRVQPMVLSTIHQAKGLEWDVVIVIGLTDGHFPNQRSVVESETTGDDGPLEEERRLFYVAMTRARRELVLVAPAQAGNPHASSWSRRGGLSTFVTELPGRLLDHAGRY